MQHKTLIALGTFFCAASLFCARVAHGQMTGNVDRLKADLYGGNLDVAVAAASALGSLKGDANARDALLGAMQLGAPPKLLSAVIEAIGLHETPVSIELLQQYAHYRNPDIRVGALKALSLIRDDRVNPLIIAALGDSHPTVRANAARILGELKIPSAERALFKLFKRGDSAAAEPLGKIGGAETARKLSELVGDAPDRNVVVALAEMLRRKDFGPDPLRNDVVKALDKIPTADATDALAEYVASVPSDETRASKKTAEQALERRKQK